MSPLLQVAIALVRAWTRLYTWNLPCVSRDMRRAEIESDLWEFQQDESARRMFPGLLVLWRLALGVYDDLVWRAEHSSGQRRRITQTAMLTAAVTLSASVVGALWFYSIVKAERLPTLPRAELVTDLAPPPPAPPPPPPPPPPPVATIGAVDVMPVPMLIAQRSDNPERPAFEVASIKLNVSGGSGGRLGFQPGGRFTVVNVPVLNMMTLAYGSPSFPAPVEALPPFRIVGGPDWIRNEAYDIAAKAEDGFVPGPGGPGPQMYRMLRTLLEDRFRLVVHKETVEQPIYELTFSRADKKLGSQLRKVNVDCSPEGRAAARKAAPPPPPPSGPPGPPPPPDPNFRPTCGVNGGPGRLIGGAVTMMQLAAQLSRAVGRSVIDKTGLTETFDLDLDYTPDQMPLGPPIPGAPPVPAADGPLIYTALQEQLGLKLEPTKGPVEVLVIDHVERPTPD